MKKRYLSGSILVLALLHANAGFSQAPDPHVGTWELNVPKSHFTNGRLPSSQTRTIVLVGDELKVTARSVIDDWRWSYSASYDGKDRPMLGAPNYDTIAITRVDRVTADFTQKKDGKVTLTGRTVIANSGKTKTITVNSPNPGGPPTQVLVYDKKNSASPQASDPILGVWELNLAKSSTVIGRLPSSQTRTIVRVGDDINTTVRSVIEDWKWSYSVRHDGRELPMTGQPNFDAISDKRTGDLTFESVQKKDGKVVLTNTRTLSKDGKTMTISAAPAKPGDPPSALWVFEKK